MLSFKPLEKDNISEWNTYVFGHKSSEVFHLAEWAFVYKDTYNYTPYYYFLLEDDRIVGVLPFIHQTGIFKNIITTPPAGILLNNVDKYKDALYSFVKDLQQKLKSSNLVLYNNYRLSTEMSVSEENVRIYKPMPSNVEDLRQSIGKKHRRNVRIATDLGLYHTVSQPADDRIDIFYQVYLRNYRDLGTPVNSINYFKKQAEYLGDYIRILIVEKDELPIGAMWLLKYKDQIISTEAATLRNFFSTRVNDYRFYQAFKYSLENGVKEYNMGRSQKDTGAYNFKKSWGNCLITDYPLYSTKKKLDIQEKRKIYSIMIKVWKNSPVSFTKLIGPIVRKNMYLE
ncbi:MAG: GNAT family N-acetyltransferase [Candidatus Cloacimonetes bacterium]|nr:GNAT family N-acetyltransferase [Candidatus Cloacimonadota bacterium]